MFDVLFNIISKKVNEQYENPSRPEPKTPTIPTTPTKKPSKKPKVPIVPVPHKRPKPKAKRNIDVELFIKARKKMLETI